ncbi:MAG: TonB-dependent receptor [Hellea sp.]
MRRFNYSKAVKASTSVLALTCLLAADAAYAQDQDDEIVVTARRTAETLIEAPVAVAAFGESAIEDLALRSVDDVARHTAGFSFSKAFGRTTERPVIRGAANILAGVQFGVEAGAAYFIDGVYYSGDLQAVDTRGLERIEVVKGPQSALYGRNTYSGAVNFITKRPSQGGFEGSIEGLVAEDGEHEFYGRVSNSISDGALGFSLSGRLYNYDGDSAWINADGGEQLGGEKTISVNAVIDANITDNFSIIGRLGHVEDDDDARPFRLIGAEQNNCYPGYRSGANYSNDGGVPSFLQRFAPWINTFDSIDPATQTDSNFQYFCGNLSQFEDLAPAQTLTAGPFFGVEREMTYGSVKSELDFANGYNLEGSFGYRQQEITTGADSNHLPGETGPANGSPYVFPISPFFSIGQPDGVFYNAGENNSFDYSLEARLSSPADKSIRWSVGAFVYDFSEDAASLSFANTTPDNLGPVVDTRTVENKAVFATVDFDVNEQLTVSLEGRYQEESKGLLERDTGYDNEVKFDKFIPKAIVSYDLSDDASAYASYAKGVKPGGINGPIGISTGDEFYAEEESDAFEIGYKTRFADGRGRVTVAGFFNDVTNYQLTTPVAVAGSTAINSVATNQGSAEIKGVEVEASFDISEYVTVGGSYAYTDAKFTKGCDDFEFVLNTGGFLISAFDRTNPPEIGTIRATAVDGTRTATAATSTPFYDPQNFFTGNLSCSIAGNRIPMTSEHQGSLYGKVEYPISDAIDMFANVDFTHEGSKFVQVHNGMETGDTNMIGAQLGVKFDNVRLEVFGRNLTDERTPPIATRWFDLQEGFNSLGHDPAGTNARAAIDRNVTGPRSAFISYRQGRQLGVRAKVDF